MSDRPLTKSAQPESQKQPSAKDESPSQKPVPVSRWSDASRWPTYLALAIAVIAAVLAGLAYFRPQHNASVPQQGGDARANVCTAYVNSRKAVIINTHLQSPNPDAQFAVAANARLALLGGGAYLRDRLAANTGAPADLASAANSFATTIEQLGMNYLTDASNDVQNPLRQTLNNQINQLDTMCK
jgi:hypothetical protein